MTAGLVTTASFRELPVSTTHVSVGSLLGIGAVTGQVTGQILEIMFAWVSTVPCAAVLAAIAYGIISAVL